MGRTGLRAVLRWCLCFCAALATASIPVASAQTHAPKIAPSSQNSALSPAKETPAPKISSPEETPSLAPEPVAEPSAEPVDVDIDRVSRRRALRKLALLAALPIVMTLKAPSLAWATTIISKCRTNADFQ